MRLSSKVAPGAILLLAITVSATLNFSLPGTYPPWADEWLALCDVLGITLCDMTTDEIDFDNLVPHGARRTFEAITTFSGHPPLMTAVHFATSGFTGNSIEAQRTVSAAAGTASTAMAWLAVRRLGYPAASGWAAMFTAMHPLAVYTSREARNYSIWLFLLLWHIGALGALGRKSSPAVIFEVIVSGILFSLTHYLSVFVLLMQALWLLSRQKVKLALTVPLACGIPTLAWIFQASRAFTNQYGVGEVFSGIGADILFKAFFRLPGIIVSGYPFSEFPLWVEVLLLLVPLWLLFHIREGDHAGGRSLLFVMFYGVYSAQVIVNFMFIIGRGQRLYFFSPRYFMPTLAGFLLLLAVSVSSIRKPVYRTVMGASVLLLWGWALFHQFTNPFFVQNGTGEIIQALDPWIKTGTVVVTPVREQDGFLRFVLANHGLSRRWRSRASLPDILSDRRVKRIVAFECLEYYSREKLDLSSNLSGFSPRFSISRRFRLFSDRVWTEAGAFVYERDGEYSVGTPSGGHFEMNFQLSAPYSITGVFKKPLIQLVKGSQNHTLEPVETSAGSAFQTLNLEDTQFYHQGEFPLDLSWHLSLEPPPLLSRAGVRSLGRPSPATPFEFTLFRAGPLPCARAFLPWVFTPAAWYIGMAGALIFSLSMGFFAFTRIWGLLRRQ